MPRELFGAPNSIPGNPIRNPALPTTMTDIYGPLPEGQAVQVPIAFCNNSASTVTLTVALTNASNVVLAHRVVDWPLLPKQVVEMTMLVAGGEKIRAKASAANAIEVQAVGGVRQY